MAELLPGKNGRQVLAVPPEKQAEYKRLEQNRIGESRLALANWQLAVENWRSRNRDIDNANRQLEAEKIAESVAWIQNNLERVLSTEIERLASPETLKELFRSGASDPNWKISVGAIVVTFAETHDGRQLDYRVRDIVEESLSPLNAELDKTREEIRQKLEYIATYRGRFDYAVQTIRNNGGGDQTNPNRGQLYLGLFYQNIEYETVFYPGILTDEEKVFWTNARADIARRKTQMGIDEIRFYLKVIPIPGLDVADLIVGSLQYDLGGTRITQKEGDKLAIDAGILVAKSVVSTIPIIGGPIAGGISIALSVTVAVANIAIATAQALLYTYILGQDFDFTSYSFSVVKSLVSSVAPVAQGVSEGVNTVLALAQPLVTAAANGEEIDTTALIVDVVAGIAGSAAGAATGSVQVATVSGNLAQIGGAVVEAEIKRGTKGRA